MEIYKVSPLDTPNQTFIRFKDESGHVCTTFKHLCQTNQYSGIRCLLLMSLDYVWGERDEFRDSNSQFKC